MCRGLLACLTLLLPTILPASQQFYVMRAEDGTIHIARSALSAAYRPLFPQETKRLLASPAKRSQWRQSLSGTVTQIAAKAGLDRALLDAVILVESGYDPGAVSIKGAIGLMQLMPNTARDLGVVDARDPRQNLLGGATYLARLLMEFEDLELALAAYNAGPQAVRDAKGVPNYPETIQYVRTIKALYNGAGYP